MTSLDTATGRDALDRIIAEVQARELLLGVDASDPYVGSDLIAIHRVLCRVRAEGLARGPVFCEWGSGLGGACDVAALSGFTAVGIEIRADLVAGARAIAQGLGLAATFSHGSFLRPGDEDLAAMASSRTEPTFDASAWDALGLEPADCDVVFAYPWPGEEAFIDAVFARHATSGALLLTFHGFGRVLVQRKLADQDALRTHGWL